MGAELPADAELRDLVGRAVAGETDALSSLLESFGPQIEQQLHIGRPWQAVIEPGDVMQVTYLEAFLQIGRFLPEQAEAFPAWLRRIADNNLRDAVRGLDRQKQPPPSRRIELTHGDESFVGLYDLLATSSSTPSRVMARKDVRRVLEAALEKLPADYSQTVRLYDLECRSIDEVAAALNRSAGAVHMLRARAHERLGELLGTAAAWFGSSA